MSSGGAADDDPGAVRRPVVLRPGEGRAYPMGRLEAVFKADGDETAHGYSISEWWLDPYTKGPDAHVHDEDDVFYVLEGTMSVLVAGQWHEASAGAFVLIPGGTPHGFENRTGQRAGMLNVSAPGTFEERMEGPHGIAPWFRANPRDTRDPDDARG